MNERYNRHHGKSAEINDRLKELASIAVSARITMESAPPTPAKFGRPTSILAQRLSDHLSDEYRKLTGEHSTRSNRFLKLLNQVFEGLGIEVKSVTSCAKTAVERYRVRNGL